MKIVLDTNVLVSAFWRPDCQITHILKSALKYELILCYNTKIIEEYSEVSSRPKFNFNKQDLNNFLETIKRKGEFIVAPQLEINFIDEDDRPFYEIAKFLNIPLITGNLKHYPKDKIVMSPAEFLVKYN
ncbi:MAG: putative toxin-antitoxin system toxin component, PIN family [Firmicutes bacterium]|nr:putative toxin-antitoxin system toxin component, PIN family [Bacillota bacterium]